MTDTAVAKAGELRQVDKYGLIKHQCITYELKQFRPGTSVRVVNDAVGMSIYDEDDNVIPYRRAIREEDWRTS